MIDREKFENKDRLIKGITKDGKFKVTVVKSTDVVRAASERHKLSYLNTLLLGRALTGTMLLASNLKGEERIQFKIEGSGPLSFLIAEATSNGEIRGYVSHSQLELDYSEDVQLGDAFGPAVLTVSKVLYNEAQPISGSVEIVNGNINDDIAYFLHQSEQIDSAISLDVGFDEDGKMTEAGGIMIQAMPDADEDDRLKLEENLKSLPQVSKLLSEGHYIDDIMEMVSTSFNVKELDRYPVDFFCRCNRDRFKNALAMISLEDLEDMEDEGQELVCHYCNESYQISKSEIAEIISEARVKMN